jgi:hypothetical protein
VSRSYKKAYVSTTCIGAKAGMQKDWKRELNRSLRRKDDELQDGGSYKKIKGDSWGPSDGKHYWDDDKARRK